MAELNRFDRVTSLWLLLQTRSVVTAQFLAERFGVSERTVYRDIRTLENAGVPIGSEPGVGYFLDKGYRLPPVCFTLDEAASLLLGEKLLVNSLDEQSLADYQLALNKIRSVIDSGDKAFLNAFDLSTQALPSGSAFPLDPPELNQEPVDRWLKESRQALLHRQVVEIHYQALNSDLPAARHIEPIGLFYYSWHWHLIAWCRLRQDYRDFRLDRVKRFSLLDEQFPSRQRKTLQQYLADKSQQESLLAVELLFSPRALRFVAEQKYLFGYLEQWQSAKGTHMRFLTAMPEYMARWLLQFGAGVQVLEGAELKTQLQQLAAELASHWE